MSLLLLQAFWFIAPAYAANAFPPVMRGRIPIDKGRMFRGRRVFGDGKTVEGFLGGIIFGVFVGSLQIYVQPYIPIGLVEMNFPLVFLLSVGAMAGDLIGSFIKRRIGLRRGESAVIMDQLGFLLTAFALASVVYVAPLNEMVVLILLTPIIHRITNIFGYLAKLKRNPW